MNTFSFSRLNLYQTCPRRFYYKYVLELDDPPGEAAILGKTVHKAIELVLNGRSFDDAVLTACMEEAGLSVDRTEVEMLTKTALSFARHYYNRETEKYIMTELSEIIIELGKGILFHGYIDLLCLCRKNEIPVILDWKTNRSPYDITSTWQILLYAAAVMEQTGVETVEGILVFLRTGHVSRSVINENMAKQAKEWAARTAEEIQHKLELIKSSRDPHGIFPSSPSVACRYCPWSYLCLKTDEDKKVC